MHSSRRKRTLGRLGRPAQGAGRSGTARPNSSARKSREYNRYNRPDSDGGAEVPLEGPILGASGVATTYLCGSSAKLGILFRRSRKWAPDGGSLPTARGR